MTMSRALTVGQTHTAGRGSRLNATTSTSTKKPVTSRTAGVGVGNRAKNSKSNNSTSHRNAEAVAGNSTSHSQSVNSSASSCSSVNQTNLSVVRTSTSPSKPRVVTLADVNSGDNLNSTSNTKNKKTASTITKHLPSPVKNCKTSGTKTGKTSKMWDNNPNPHPVYKTSSTSQRGNRNVIASNHGNSNGSPPGSSSTSDSVSQGQDVDSERQATYQPQGGFTRIAPDPKKRDKLQSQRSEELARLEAYKEKTKLGHVSIKPSRVGGSKQSEEETRRQQERELKDKKYQNIQKRQQWAEEKKQREDAEFAEKKAKARQQTERNKQIDRERQTVLQAERHKWIARGGLERLHDGGGGTSGAAHDDKKEYEIDEGDVDGLAEIFPFKSRKKLVEMLVSADGDMNKVIDWLAD